MPRIEMAESGPATLHLLVQINWEGRPKEGSQWMTSHSNGMFLISNLKGRRGSLIKTAAIEFICSHSKTGSRIFYSETETMINRTYQANDNAGNGSIDLRKKHSKAMLGQRGGWKINSRGSESATKLLRECSRKAM